MSNTNSSALNEEDEQVLRAKQDSAHFQPLYEKYYEPILRFVYQRVETKEEARDLTQQVFLQALSNIGKYELRGFPFSSWLYRIASNELNMQFRKGKKQRCISIEERHVHTLTEEINTGGNEFSVAMLGEVMATLGEDDFNLVEMRFFEKRPFKEIGEVLEVTEATAKMRLYRILERMKPELEKRLRD